MHGLSRLCCMLMFLRAGSLSISRALPDWRCAQTPSDTPVKQFLKAAGRTQAADLHNKQLSSATAGAVGFEGLLRGAARACAPPGDPQQAADRLVRLLSPLDDRQRQQTAVLLSEAPGWSETGRPLAAHAASVQRCACALSRSSSCCRAKASLGAPDLVGASAAAHRPLAAPPMVHSLAQPAALPPAEERTPAAAHCSRAGP